MWSTGKVICGLAGEATILESQTGTSCAKEESGIRTGETIGRWSDNTSTVLRMGSTYCTHSETRWNSANLRRLQINCEQSVKDGDLSTTTGGSKIYLQNWLEE